MSFQLIGVFPQSLSNRLETDDLVSSLGNQTPIRAVMLSSSAMKLENRFRAPNRIVNLSKNDNHYITIIVS